MSIEIEHSNSSLSIGTSAFFNCSILENCIISSSTNSTYIKQEAFANTESLTSLNLCNVVEIGPSAFYGSGLQNDGDDTNYIVLPDSVSSIGQNAFGKCSMTQISLNGRFGNRNEICCEHPIFNGCDSLNYIHLTSTTYSNFCSACSSDNYVFPEITSFLDKEQVSAAWLSVKNWFFANDGEIEPRTDIYIRFSDIYLQYSGEITGYNCLSLDNTNTILLSIITSLGDFEVFAKNPILPPNINKI